MGSHVYSLTTLGYLEPDTFSVVITGKAGRSYPGYFYEPMRLNFAFVPFVPGHQIQ